MGSSGGGLVRKLSVVCLHNNGIIAEGILVTILHCVTPEPSLSAIYIVSSVGTSFPLNIRILTNGIVKGLTLNDTLRRQCCAGGGGELCSVRPALTTVYN